MPVYVRQEALEVPTPTLSECSEEGIQDPEEIFPERTGTAGYVREVLSDVFNTCWMSVEKKQNEKGAANCLKICWSFEFGEILPFLNYLFKFIK